MINLLKFYKDNVTVNEYYYKFYNELITYPEKTNKELEAFSGYKNEELEQFEFFDDDDVIERFKYMCQPDTDTALEINKRLFYFICFYLYKNGYSIREFPRILKRPPEHIYEFTYKEIRNRLVTLGKQRPNGEVPYSERRILVANLTFEKDSSIVIKENINDLFQKVSTRNANFEMMSNDEKLREIANLIEYMLVEDGKFKQLNYEEIAFEYIDDKLIKAFRKQIQCFRHASQSSIEEREQFTELQKDFMINYGIIIINIIYKLTVH